MQRRSTRHTSGREEGHRDHPRARVVAAALCAGAGGMLALAGFAPAASASPVRTPAVPAAAECPRGAGGATGGGPAAGTSAPVLHHPIEGSDASPLVHATGGPLSDQLWVDPGSTDATLMGNHDNNGPAAGGLLPVGSAITDNKARLRPPSAGGPTGPVRKGSIEGSAASPVVHARSGPLSDQLWVDPGSTDATLMGNHGNSGPAAGGLLPVGSGPVGAAPPPSTGTGGGCAAPGTTSAGSAGG